jgi:hypothetical protein
LIILLWIIFVGLCVGRRGGYTQTHVDNFALDYLCWAVCDMSQEACINNITGFPELNWVGCGDEMELSPDGHTC